MIDCFAYKNKGCKVLKVKSCEGCSFHKTKEQYQEDYDKAMERILSLDADTLEYINRTYYGGKLEV